MVMSLVHIRNFSDGPDIPDHDDQLDGNVWLRMIDQKHDRQRTGRRKL